MKLTAAALALTLASTLILPGTTFAQEGMPAPNAVTMMGNMFVLPEMTVPAGTTVTWTNNDAEDHDVATDDLTILSPAISPGQSFSFTFQAPGTYAYLCSTHTGMDRRGQRHGMTGGPRSRRAPGWPARRSRPQPGKPDGGRRSADRPAARRPRAAAGGRARRGRAAAPLRPGPSPGRAAGAAAGC